ncbi:MAG: hypothetical protein K0U20_08290, partial [Proteobacteria bacterium]|nr:hypothetical protein [Pseudomonadota bacterium]
AILIQYTYFQWIEYEGISSEIAFSRVYDVISAVTWSVLLLVMKSIVSIYVQNKVKEAYFAQQVPISPQEGFNNNSNEKQF